jgi:hypothetical protein
LSYPVETAAAAACRPLLQDVEDRGSERVRDAEDTADAVLVWEAACEDLVDIPVFAPFARVGGGLSILFKKYGDVENVDDCGVSGTTAAQAGLIRAMVCGRVRKWKSDMVGRGEPTSNDERRIGLAI